MCGTLLQSGIKVYFTVLVLSAMVVIIFVVLYGQSSKYHKPIIVSSQGVLNPKLRLSEKFHNYTGGFKAWMNGLVTVLEPEIPRNCQKLFDNDKEEIERVKNDNKIWTNVLSDDEFLRKTRSCSWIREELSNNLYNTQLEKQFPLAFTFVIHKYPQQVFRLFKLLYRPQNVFCFHYDAKSADAFKEVFNNLAKCLDNVMIASKIIDVEWGTYTTMEAQMNCFSDLLWWRKFGLPVHQQWKYTLNLCGTELPLVTTRDIVVHLMKLNGSSSLSVGKIQVGTKDWNRVHHPIPHNMTYYKSSSYNALSYEFIKYLITDPVGKDMHAYFHTGLSPEEHLYPTVYMHPGVPGGYREELKGKYVRVSEAKWCFDRQCEAACRGKVVRNVCVCTAGDLPMIMSRAKHVGNFFHNKYTAMEDHTAMDCLEERIVKRNQEEYYEDHMHIEFINHNGTLHV